MVDFEAVSGIPADAGDELDRFMSGDPGEEDPAGPPVDGTEGSGDDDPLDAWMSGDATAGAEEGDSPAEPGAGDDPIEAWMSGDAKAEPEGDPLEEWMSGDPGEVAGLGSSADSPVDGDAGDGFEDYVPGEPAPAADAASPMPGHAPQRATGSVPSPGASGGFPPMMPEPVPPAPQPELAISGDRVPNGPQGMLSVLAGCVGLALSPFALPFAAGIALIVLAGGGLGLGIAGIRTQGRVMAALGIAMNVAVEAWRVFLMLS